MTRPGSIVLARRSGSGPPPLPASAVEYWIDDKSVAMSAPPLIDSWTGQLRSTVVQNTGAGRPTYGVDTGFFKGRSVPLFAGGTTLRTASNLTTPLILSGAKPWIYIVCRLRGGLSSNACFVSFMNGLPAASWPGGSLCINQPGGGWAFENFGWGDYAWGPFPDTLQHRFETGLDSAGAVIVRMDGVIGNRAAGGSGHAAPTDARAVTFGNDHAQGWPLNGAIPFCLLCNAALTAPERAALEAWSIGRYG